MNLFSGTIATGFDPKRLTYKRAETLIDELEQLEMLICGSQRLEGREYDKMLNDISDYIHDAMIIFRDWFGEHGHELRGAPKELIELMKGKNP